RPTLVSRESWNVRDQTRRLQEGAPSFRECKATGRESHGEGGHASHSQGHPFGGSAIGYARRQIPCGARSCASCDGFGKPLQQRTTSITTSLRGNAPARTRAGHGPQAFRRNRNEWDGGNAAVLDSTEPATRSGGTKRSKSNRHSRRSHQSGAGVFA